jgi:hypothetical protein
MSATFVRELFLFSAIGTKPNERQKVWIANHNMTAGNSSEQPSRFLSQKLP